MKAENTDGFDASMGRGSDLDSDSIFVGFMASLRLGLWADVGILLLCDADHKHHLVMRPDDISINPLCLGIHWTPSVIELLC